MTRDEFISGANTWDSIIEFCCNHDIDEVGDIYDKDEMDDCINSYLCSMAEDMSWEEMRDALNHIPSGCNRYYCDNYEKCKWYDLEDLDFGAFKRYILEIADIRQVWDIY